MSLLTLMEGGHLQTWQRNGLLPRKSLKLVLDFFFFSLPQMSIVWLLHLGERCF